VLSWRRCVRSGSGYRIPECRRSLVVEAETAEGELILANTTKQFHSSTGHGSRGEVPEPDGVGTALNLLLAARQKLDVDPLVELARLIE